MAFDPSKPYIGYDAQVPILGSLLASGEMRENLRAVATLARGNQEPVTPAQLRGDTRKFPVNLSVKTTLRVKIDAAAYHNIDVSTGGPGASAPASRLLSDIVWKINDRLNAHLGTSSVVYAFESDGYLLIRSVNTDPAVSVVGIDTVANDAQTKVLFLEMRGVASWPYVVVGTDVTRGRLWLQTDATYEHVLSTLQLRVDRPARLLGNSLGPFNLTVKKWLRLQIDGGAVFEIDLANGGTTPTLAQVVSRINAAVGATVAYSHAKGLLIQSTTTGPNSQVKIDRPQSSGYEDAAPTVFGFEAGDGQKVWNKYPIIDNGQDWNSTWLRNAEATPGIGTWGAPAQSKSWLGSVHAGAFHGEQRTSLVSRVTYSWDAASSNWLLAGPSGLRHVEFDTTFEAYKLRHATHPWYGYLDDEDDKTIVSAEIRVGDTIELTDSKREDYPAVTSSGIDLQRPHDARDCFDRNNSATLTTSSGGDAWVQTAASGDGFRIASNKAAFDGTPGGTDYAVLDYALATEQDVAILCSISAKTSGSNADANPCELGVIVRAVDASNCIYVTIDDRGTVKVIRKVAGADATLQTFTAGGDPPPDTSERVLRVRTTAANKLSVYWGGSFDPTDWGAEDAVPDSFESRFLVGVVNSFTAVGGGDTKSGLYGKVIGGSQKEIYVNGFIGRNRAVSDLAGLPAVPGNNLRHIITSVRNPDDTDDTGTIQDCTPDKPLYLRDNGGDGGIILKQTTASRQIAAMLGGPALKVMGSGFHMTLGDPDQGYNLSDTATYCQSRVTVGPGFAVLPTGNAYPSHEIRWSDAPLVLALNGADPKYQIPLNQGGGSPSAQRFYYVYVAADPESDTGLVLEYSLTPPNARGELTQDGKYLRFVGSVFWQNPGTGNNHGFRGFWRSGHYTRYARRDKVQTGSISPSNLGVEIWGDASELQQYNPGAGNYGATFNLFDDGSSPKKCVPKTASTCVYQLGTSAPTGEFMVLRTSLDAGNMLISSADFDNDGEASGPVPFDGIVLGSHTAKSQADTAHASVVGYYEDPFSLPVWLG